MTWPVAVRSSGVGEDSAGASFAGQHLTRLNVVDQAGLSEAVTAIWLSARSEAALSYRARLGIEGAARTGVVVQRLLDPEVAGVLFTRNPISGADERVIEASFGLGEAVVAGSVVPDPSRLAPDGTVLEWAPGWKTVALRFAADGGTIGEPLAQDLVDQLSLDDRLLAELHDLAARCEDVFGAARDIE